MPSQRRSPDKPGSLCKVTTITAKSKKSRLMVAKPQPGETIWGPPISPNYVRNVGQTDPRIIALEVKS